MACVDPCGPLCAPLCPRLCPPVTPWGTLYHPAVPYGTLGSTLGHPAAPCDALYHSGTPRIAPRGTLGSRVAPPCGTPRHLVAPRGTLCGGTCPDPHFGALSQPCGTLGGTLSHQVAPCSTLYSTLWHPADPFGTLCMFLISGSALQHPVFPCGIPAAPRGYPGVPAVWYPMAPYCAVLHKWNHMAFSTAYVLWWLLHPYSLSTCERLGKASRGYGTAYCAVYIVVLAEREGTSRSFYSSSYAWPSFHDGLWKKR